MADTPQASISVTADSAPLRKALASALGEVSRFASDSKTKIEGVSTAGEALAGRMRGIAAAVSGAAFVGFVKSMIDMQDEMSKTAQKAGTTTEKFTSMNYAAKLADVSTEQLSKAYAKLSTILVDAQNGGEKAGKMLKDLGIDPAKVADSDALLLALAERFSGMENDARKTALAIDIFGEKLGPGLIPFLNQGREGIEQLRDEAKRLGLVISDEAGKAAEEFNDNMTKLGAASTGAFNAIATELVPALVQASDYFVKATKEAGLFQGALISIGALMAKGLGMDERGQLESQMGTLRGEAERLKGMLIGVDNVLAREPGNEMAQRRHATLTAKLKALNQEIANTEKAIVSLGAGSSTAGAGRGSVNPELAIKPGGGATGDGPTRKAGGKEAAPELAGPKNADASMMGYFENALAQERRVLFELEAGRQMSRAQEADFWRDILDRTNLTAQDRLAIERRVSTLRFEARRQELEQTQTLEQVRTQATERRSLIELESDQEAARQRYQNGELTLAQILALEAQFEERKFQVQADALQARIELAKLDPNGDPVELERRQNELIELQMRYQARLRGIQTQQAGASGKEGGMSGFSSQLTTMLGSEATWENLFNGILTKTTTWRQAMSGLFASVGQTFISNVVAKPLAEWAAGHARMLMVKMGFLAAEKTAQATASASTAAIKSTEASTVVGANAAGAASGAASALASIPIVGPALAAGAMPVMFAAVMALLSRGGMKSAAGGYDIPSFAEPLTQLHQEEMVLPSPLANVVRRMAAQGEDGGQQYQQGPTVMLNATPMGGGFWVAQEREFVKFAKELKRDRKLQW